MQQNQVPSMHVLFDCSRSM